MSKYLKEEVYYNNLYDLFTVQECLRSIKSWNSTIKEKSNTKELKKYSEEDKARYFKSALNIAKKRVLPGGQNYMAGKFLKQSMTKFVRISVVFLVYCMSGIREVIVLIGIVSKRIDRV